MFDDVRLHSQGRTFIFPVGFGGGKSPIPAFPKGKEFYPNVFARGGLVNCPFCERVKYQLRVTPTANRNSYRVAILVVQLPRVACFARNPGLGKRNSVRVAAADTVAATMYPHEAQCGTLRHYIYNKV